MKEIILTNGTRTQVSDNWFDFLSQWKWELGRTGYAVRRVTKSGKRISIYMHRVILYSPDFETDHIDRDRLNNTISNLRLCSHSNNSKNRSKHKNNTTGFIGVSKHKLTGMYQASIRVSGKKIHLGLWNDKSEAAQAYDSAAIQYFGEFANTNFTQEFAQ